MRHDADKWRAPWRPVRRPRHRLVDLPLAAASLSRLTPSIVVTSDSYTTAR